MLESPRALHFAPAQYALAQLVETGQGTKRDIRRAEELYRKAALNPEYESVPGNSRGYALTAVGTIHYHGFPPFRVDYKEARKWFEKGVKLGHADAQYVRVIIADALFLTLLLIAVVGCLNRRICA